MAQSAANGPWWHDEWAEAARQQRLDEDQQVAELVPAEWAGIHLLNRLRASVGRRLTVTLDGSASVSGVVDEVGVGWFMLSDQGTGTLVCLRAVSSMDGLAKDAPVDSPPSRLPQTAVWRQWARQRAHVQIRLHRDFRIEGSVLRVGRDFVDVVEHPRDRRPLPSDRTTTIACDAVAWASTTA